MTTTWWLQSMIRSTRRTSGRHLVVWGIPPTGIITGYSIAIALLLAVHQGCRTVDLYGVDMIGTTYASDRVQVGNESVKHPEGSRWQREASQLLPLLRWLRCHPKLEVRSVTPAGILEHRELEDFLHRTLIDGRANESTTAKG